MGAWCGSQRVHPTPGKAEAALALGARDPVVSTDAAQMAAQAARFDFILDIVGAPHELGPYFDTLGIDGTLCLVGIPPEAPRVHPMGLIVGARRLAGSGSGEVPETQEMLDLCAEHGITADVETITPDRPTRLSTGSPATTYATASYSTSRGDRRRARAAL